MEPAAELLTLLQRVRALEFTARSGRPDGWNGRGRGTVEVAPGADRVIFHESGEWRDPAGKTLHFKNTYRWTKNSATTVRLEHLRFGEQHAVHLLDLAAPAGTSGCWRSSTPHHCGEDLYTGSLLLTPLSLRLLWVVKGPRKEEQVTTHYRFDVPTA